MSLAVPFTNHQYNTSGGARLDAPAAAVALAANTGFVIGMWVRPPDRVYQQNRRHTFLGGQNALTGGSDSYFGFPNAADQIQANVKYGGTTYLSKTLALGASAYGKTLLVMLIADATAMHVVACEPGGTPVVETQAGSGLYALATGGTAFLNRIGSAPNSAFYGDIEEFFHVRGAFPMTGGAPTTATVQAIADGSLDLDTLHTTMSGTRMCRYRMRDTSDLSDAWGLQSDLTPALTDAPKGKVFRNGGPLRPIALSPARTRACASLVTFATRGTATGATARIRTEGGAYAGIAPAAIQARILKADGTTHVDWTTVDAAPSGGTWAAGQIAGVPMVAGFLTQQFRAVDGGGSQIGEIVNSHGLRATAAHVSLSCAQSQLMHLYEFGSLALPDGINILSQRQYGTASPTGQTEEAIITSGCPNGAILGWGMRQAAIEINALYPGVPIHFMTVGQSGEPLGAFLSGGTYGGRWANLAAHIGLIQDMRALHFGHSNVPEANAAAYETNLGNVRAAREAAFGAMRTVVFETPRYSLSGTVGNHAKCQIARDGSWQFYQDNADVDWGGNMSCVYTSEASSDPHPAVSDLGHGRSGALLAWGAMRADGAVADVPMGIVTATASGTTVKLKIAAI